MRKKILFVITKSNFGGAQRYVYDLATQLLKICDVSVAFGGTGIHYSVEGTLAKKLSGAGVKTIFVPSLGRDVKVGGDFRALLDLVKLFKKERPHAVHLNSSKAGGVGALAARIAEIPRIVFTVHGLPYDENRNIVMRFAIFFATWITFLLCHNVICISEDNARRARMLPFVGRRVRFIPNGIGDISFIDHEKARSILLKGAGKPQGTLWFGTIAELTKNKGLFYALAACQKLKVQGLKFSFFIIGEGEDRKLLEAEVRHRGLSEIVYFLGYIPEAERFLKAFDVFVLSSIKEGLPYVLLEAGKAGLPVVGSDIPGIRDIVENGVSGILVSEKNSEALAEALTRMKNPETRERFGTALEKRVKENFFLTRMVEETRTLY